MKVFLPKRRSLEANVTGFELLFLSTELLATIKSQKWMVWVFGTIPNVAGKLKGLYIPLKILYSMTMYIDVQHILYIYNIHV